MAEQRIRKSPREHREALGISREQLARRADVSTSTINRLELEDHIPNALALRRIALVLGVLMEDLLPVPDTTDTVVAAGT